MAKPRIFVSSTFYDLKQIRADIEKFIRDYNFEPILNESGTITYGKDENLDEYCYREVELSDMLIAIIGGRYGSASSSDDSKSITQKEIETALENGKQVYIFIDKAVNTEFLTYQINKDSKDIKYAQVNEKKIFEFIEKIKLLHINNTIHPFETAQDITNYLKEQWSGLFHRLLQDDSRKEQVNLIQGIERTANTLNDLVVYLTKEKQQGAAAINNILMMNHPAMEQLMNIFDSKYRIFFTNKKELDQWLQYARGFRHIRNMLIRKDGKVHIRSNTFDGYYIWTKRIDNRRYKLKIKSSIFNSDNTLKLFTKSDWNNDNIQYITEIDEVEPLES